MTKKPLLIFPKPSNASKTNKNGGPGNLKFPTTDEQITRLESSITNLQRVLENQTAYLGSTPAGFISEMILVLEIAGTIEDFYRAIKRTPGMEFLAEHQTEILPDQNFYLFNDKGEFIEKPVPARLFLTMTNYHALNELLKYWKEFKKPVSMQKFPHGTKRFRKLFEQLNEIRPYSIEDRLRDTGFGGYVELMKEYGFQDVYFEIELVYKNSEQRRQSAFTEVVKLISEAGGNLISNSVTLIPEINYHAFIAKAPIKCFEILNENTNVKFLKSQQILYFRPVGQSISLVRNKEVTEVDSSSMDIEFKEAVGEPIVALLDGLPLENHSVLENRLIVDDPDGYSNNYIAESRNHGTAMASLILNGDLENPQQKFLTRPLYVRPIMKADTFSREYLPEDKLPVDLIHRAVRRMFEGENGIPPVAPHVRIINFSIGDSYRPFHYQLSTWAKLIDWLSYKYNVLFLISAGNKNDDIILDVSEEHFNTLSLEEKEKLTIKAIVSENYDRKILTPGESINSITVGACHSDFSKVENYYQRINLISNSHLLSPISRIGFGYNGSVKPEILMPGGVQLYRKLYKQSDSKKLYLKCEDPHLSYPPGNKVAIPGKKGENNNFGYTCGTSNATALTANLAGQLYEMLLELNDQLLDENKIDSKYLTVILKSLLVHGASWGDATTLLEETIKNLSGVATNYSRKHLFPYLGYGVINTDRILYCTNQRVTLIGYGELSKDNGQNAHLFSFPLPPSVGQKKIKKRLIVTLSWLTPLNYNSAKYRKAHLFFDNLNSNGHLTLERNSYDFRVSQKGTVQHDILIGDKADAFIDGDKLNIKVNCREYASELNRKEKIRYALCVTFEVMDSIETEIYEEVQLRLRQQIRPRV